MAESNVYHGELKPNLKFDYVPIKEVNIGGTPEQKDWLRTETFIDTVSKLLKEPDVQKAGGFMVIRPKNYKGAQPFLYPKDHNHDDYHPKQYDMNHTMNVFGVQNLKTYFNAQIHVQQCKQVKSQIFKWRNKQIYHKNKTVKEEFELNLSKPKNRKKSTQKNTKKKNTDKNNAHLPFDVIVNTNGEQITQTQSGRIVKVYSQNQDIYAELDRYLEAEHEEEEDSEDIDINHRKRKRNDDHQSLNREISPTKKRKLSQSETQTKDIAHKPQIQIHSDGVFTIDYTPSTRTKDLKYQYPFELTATMPEPDDDEHDSDAFKLETRTSYIHKEQMERKSNYSYETMQIQNSDKDLQKMPSPSISHSPSRSISPTKQHCMHINRGFACAIEQIEQRTKKRIEIFWDKESFETQLKSNVYLGATAEEIPLIFCDYLKSGHKVQYAIVDEESTYHFESPLQLNQLSRYGPFSALTQNEVMLGIQLPYVYIGQQHAFFPFHREDMNLFAVNHLLWGCNKLWYCIHPRDHEKVLRFVRKQYCTEINKNCETPLQHKVFWFDPYILLCMGIKVFFIRQQPGDIVITPPGGIHGGLNAGPNMAESINFMTYDIDICWKPVLSAMLFYCHNFECEVCITHAFLDVNRLAMRLRKKTGDEYKDKVPDRSIIYEALPISTSFRNMPKYKNADKYISRSFKWIERLSLKSRYLHSMEYREFNTALNIDRIYPYYVQENNCKVNIYPVKYNGTFKHGVDALIFEPLYSISYLNDEQKENESVSLQYILKECGVKHRDWNEKFDENAVRFQMQNRLQFHNIHIVFCYKSFTKIKTKQQTLYTNQIDTNDLMNSVKRRKKIKSKRVIADSDTDSDED